MLVGECPTRIATALANRGCLAALACLQCAAQGKLKVQVATWEWRGKIGITGQLKLLRWSCCATVAHLGKMHRLKNSEKCPFPHQQNQEQLQRNPAVLETRCCRGFRMHPRWNCATVAGKRQMASNISFSGKVAATFSMISTLELACLKEKTIQSPKLETTSCHLTAYQPSSASFFNDAALVGGPSRFPW